MTENANGTAKYASLERQPSQARRHLQPTNSPLTPSEYDWRGSSSFQPGLQQKKIFGFQIFIDNDILRQFEDVQKWFQSIVQANKVEQIKFNPDLSIPDLNGRNIQVYDKQMEKKYQGCRMMLNEVYQKFKKSKTEAFSIIIFVPEGMVSLLIGTKGHQINKIMKESHTTIVVNQPINRMTYRTVKIQGHHSDIARACRIIYEILEEKSSIAYSIEKQPSQLDYSKAKVKTKFIFSSAALEYVQSRNKQALKKIEEQTKSSIKFLEDTSSRLLRKDEDICIINGRLEDAQAMLVMLINFIQQYYNEERKATQYTLKMLIPSNYVTKLIGQKGYMIRDIIDRSGGAQIKILSDKQSERDVRECVISINGTKQNKIDASCFVLQQIECFKNGGPILQSGKSINENLAQQFKNSIPFRIEEENNQLQQQYIEEINVNQTTSAQLIAEELPGHLSHPINSEVAEKPIDAVHQSLAQQKIQQDSPKVENEDLQIEEGMILDKTPKKQVVQTINTVQLPNLTNSLPQFLTKSKTEEVGHRRIHRAEPSPSRSRSISRSRERKSKRSKKAQGKQRNRSKSSSVEFKHEKQYVEINILVPRKLAADHKELRYIQSLSKSQIINVQHKGETSTESIISVRGSLKDNTRCLKFIQKRLARLSTHNSSTAR